MHFYKSVAVAFAHAAHCFTGDYESWQEEEAVWGTQACAAPVFDAAHCMGVFANDLCNRVFDEGMPPAQAQADYAELYGVCAARFGVAAMATISDTL